MNMVTTVKLFLFLLFLLLLNMLTSLQISKRTCTCCL